MISEWPLAKQYLAAHFYLSQEHPLNLSEAQRTQLAALHLYISNGPWKPGIKPSYFNRSTNSEKKKRIEEWQKIGNMSKQTAMSIFIELISSFFPQWTRHKGLNTDFEKEWTKIEHSENLNSDFELPKINRKQKKNLVIPFQLKTNKKTRIFPKQKNYLDTEIFQFSQQPKTKHTKAKSLIYSHTHQPSSRAPRVDTSIQIYREKRKKGDFLKDFIENMQSYKGTHIRTTSATKLPEAGKHLEVPDDFPVKPPKEKAPPSTTGKAFNMHEVLKKRLKKLNEALKALEQEFELKIKIVSSVEMDPLNIDREILELLIARMNRVPATTHPSDDEEETKDFSGSLLETADLQSEPISHMLYKREAGIPGQWHVKISQKQVPKTVISIQTRPTCANFDSRVYNGQFSPGGDLYYCSSEDEIHIYDTSDPYEWKFQREFPGIMVEWTITDIDISPSEKYLIYSTINSHVSLFNLYPDPDDIYGVTREEETLSLGRGSQHFGIWSVRFSGLGNELLAGTTNHSIEIFDIKKRIPAYTVQGAHRDDINAVCWANRDESEVFFTGSDDSTIKIWDRRSIGRSKEAEGVLVGHREGITHISSRGDGIHVISNGKDQCLKLWDIRSNKTHEEYVDFASTHEYSTHFDYRWSNYPDEGYTKRLAADTSLMTFRGHKVLSTLIRCYFSPLFSTAERYIVSGSADGRVFVFDSVTGKTAAILDESDINPCVRDVSWHPTIPLIAATSFGGTVKTYT